MRTKQQDCFPCLESTRFTLTTTTANGRQRLTKEGERVVLVASSSSKGTATEWTMANNDNGILQTIDGGFLVKKNGENSLKVDEPNNEENKGRQLVFVTLELTDSGLYILRCGENEMVALDAKNGDDKLITVPYQQQHHQTDVSAKAIPPLFWNLEICSGELVFISNSTFDKRLRCECDGFLHLPWVVSGGLSLSKEWYGWDVWRLIEVGNGSVMINSWTHRDKVLCADETGKVFTGHKDTSPSDQKQWNIEKLGNILLIRSSKNHRILYVDDSERKLRTVDGSARPAGCCWALEPAHRNVFYISSKESKKTISCKNKEGHVNLTDDKGNDQAAWKVEFQDTDDVTTVTIQNVKFKHFLVVENDGLSTSKEPFGWRLDESPHGGFFLLGNGRYLTTSTISEEKQGIVLSLALLEIPAAAESWLLEPRMPDTMTTRQRNIIAGSVVAGVAVTALAPLAVVGVVTYIGFGAGGIVGGSTAAAMMSAEAIASGGTIAAGGTVATLQSIGAAGLGVAGTSAAVGGGAVVGSTVVGATGALVQRGHVRAGATTEHVAAGAVNRPFANWKNWSTNIQS